ncbi:hypothetical protein [Pseudactinotalea sp.]|uniref:beta barrel domain-containing protein n=1 Tax=Pseudactinotalea sp. TaxID=1926260 RepID=UPI003B3B633C
MIEKTTVIPPEARRQAHITPTAGRVHVAVTADDTQWWDTLLDPSDAMALGLELITQALSLASASAPNSRLADLAAGDPLVVVAGWKTSHYRVTRKGRRYIYVESYGREIGYDMKTGEPSGTRHGYTERACTVEAHEYRMRQSEAWTRHREAMRRVDRREVSLSPAALTCIAAVIEASERSA